MREDPRSGAIPEDAAVRSYSVVDRYRFLWIWMGDAAQADDTSIPDLYWNDDPEWVAPGDTLTIDANYLLVLDNLMDLSHLTFLHGRTIGTPYVTEFPSTARTADDRVSVTRWMIDRPAPPMFEKVGGFTGQRRPLADHRLERARQRGDRRRLRGRRHGRAAGRPQPRHRGPLDQPGHSDDRALDRSTSGLTAATTDTTTSR